MFLFSAHESTRARRIRGYAGGPKRRERSLVSLNPAWAKPGPGNSSTTARASSHFAPHHLNRSESQREATVQYTVGWAIGRSAKMPAPRVSMQDV